MTIFTVEEHEELELAESDFTEATGEFLYDHFSSEVEIQFPTPVTRNRWVLRNDGYAGFIQLPDGDGIELVPKVELTNVFAMLEYAFDLDQFGFQAEGLYDTDTVKGFYDRIANILAQTVLNRRRKGMYRTYQGRRERSGVIRGRIDFTESMRRPWDHRMDISYREMTADNEDNQLLLYTLSRASLSDLCRPDTEQLARRAIRNLRDSITYRQFSPQDAAGRDYNRLNRDYERMHALCRLILEYSGPTHEAGDRQMIPWTVDMATLYERFVSRWLQRHLPDQFYVNPQERVPLGETGLNYHIDNVLYRRGREDPVCVLDTKYKVPESPSSQDVSQMVGYAAAVGVDETFLLYPTSLAEPFTLVMDGVRIRDLTFALDGDLDANGRAFLEELAVLIGEPELAATTRAT